MMLRDPTNPNLAPGDVFTSEPGVQFCSGNSLDRTVNGNDGIVYRKHRGFRLEAQHFPDPIHHENFPSVVFEPGRTYTQTTVYCFLG